MELNNRITFYIAIFVVLAILFSPCDNAQMGGRGSRGGDMMGGGPYGEDMMGGGPYGGDMMGGGPRGSGDRGRSGMGRSGMGRGGPMGPRYPQEEELSESQIDRVLKQLKTYNPTKAEELNKLRKTDKEQFTEELWKSALPLIISVMGTDREYRRTLEWCEKFVPDEAKGIRELQDNDYDLYKKKLDALGDKYHPLINPYTRPEPDELMRISVRDLQLRNKLSELIMQHRSRRITADEKERIESELEAVLSEQYDQGIKRAKYEYKQIEERIKGLQDLLKQQMSITAEMEVPEVKENAVKKELDGITSPRRGFGGFGSRRSSSMPPIFQSPDQNSTSAP